MEKADLEKCLLDSDDNMAVPSNPNWKPVIKVQPNFLSCTHSVVITLCEKLSFRSKT